MTEKIKPFGVDPDDFEVIRQCALEAVKMYGSDDEHTHQRILKDGIWNDHIAVQAGVAVYKQFRFGQATYEQGVRDGMSREREDTFKRGDPGHPDNEMGM